MWSMDLVQLMWQSSGRLGVVEEACWEYREDGVAVNIAGCGQGMKPNLSTVLSLIWGPKDGILSIITPKHKH